MPLSTYNELVESVISWSHRKDINLLIPDFISLAETDMFNNPDEILETREIEKTSTATLVGTPPNESRVVALPPNYIQQRDIRVTILDREIDLQYRTPSTLRIRDGVGTPCFFTVTDQLEFDIVPDQDYVITIKYWAEIDPLTATNQTNEILTNNPNVYLYGALKQLFIWSEDDNEAVKYDGLFTDAIKGANKKAKAGRYGKTPTMKYKGPTA